MNRRRVPTTPIKRSGFPKKRFKKAEVTQLYANCAMEFVTPKFKFQSQKLYQCEKERTHEVLFGNKRCTWEGYGYLLIGENSYHCPNCLSTLIEGDSLRIQVGSDDED